MNEEISKNMLKSQTSIVGIVCKDGVVMAADRRATAGNFVADKSASKIQPLSKYAIAAWTGGVADAQISTKILSAELRLKELKTKSRASITETANLVAMTFYKNIRTPSMIPAIVGFLVAGYDEDGTSSLYSVWPSGDIIQVREFDTNVSSGTPYILGLLERQYKKDLSIKEGVELAKECIKSSTQRDTGSGNGIDVFTITKDGIKHVVSEEIIPQYK
jgi:proteasome beta subunit